MNHLRILAIDDDPSVLALYCAYLSGCGHTVETALNGAEGLERFRTGHWDVVVTDRVMPLLNGEELAAAVKAINPSMPVVMVSGALGEEYGRIEPGRAIDVFVRKPFSLTELIDGITKAVEATR